MDLLLVTGLIVLFPFTLLLLPIELLRYRASQFGAKISRKKAARMLLMKLTKKEYLQAIGIVQNNDTGLSEEQIETHHLAGGNPKKVIEALINAQQQELEVTFQQLSAIDLMGKDVDQMLIEGFCTHSINMTHFYIRNICLNYTVRFRYGLAIAFNDISREYLENKIKERLSAFAESWESKNIIKTEHFLQTNVLNAEFWTDTLRVILIGQQIKVLSIT